MGTVWAHAQQRNRRLEISGTKQQAPATAVDGEVAIRVMRSLRLMCRREIERFQLSGSRSQLGHVWTAPRQELSDALQHWSGAATCPACFYSHHAMSDCATTGKSTIPHSISSSEATRMDCGTASPSAFAVLRLRTISNLVGNITGRLAGFSPLKNRPQIIACLAIGIRSARAVADQTAGLDNLAISVNRNNRDAALTAPPAGRADLETWDPH